MKSILVLMVSFSIPAWANLQELPCQATIAQWEAVVPQNIPTRTCQVTVQRLYSTGKCTKSVDRIDQNGNTIEVCQRWNKITLEKTGKLVCGGAVLAHARQQCHGTNTDHYGVDAQIAASDYELSSIFTEQMAQQGFKVTHEQTSYQYRETHFAR